MPRASHPDERLEFVRQARPTCKQIIFHSALLPPAFLESGVNQKTHSWATILGIISWSSIWWHDLSKRSLWNKRTISFRSTNCCCSWLAGQCCPSFSRAFFSCLAVACIAISPYAGSRNGRSTFRGSEEATESAFRARLFRASFVRRRRAALGDGKRNSEKEGPVPRPDKKTKHVASFVSYYHPFAF